MTHIICRAMNCVFWEGGVCSAEEIEYEPDAGCMTFQDVVDAELDESEEIDWESEEDLFEDEDEDEDEDWDSDEDDWGDDDF